MFVVTRTRPATVGPADEDAASWAARARVAGADLLEIRGDMTPDQAPFDSELPWILSPRGQSFSAALLRSAEERKDCWIDLEDDESPPISVPTERLIRSWHEYDRMPGAAEIRSRVTTMRARGAGVVKIAVTPREPSDLWILHELQDELRGGGAICFLAMGRLARLNRILSPFRNFMTYAALSADTAAAPGQLTLEDHGSPESGPPRLFGILGGREMKTLSPRIHEALFRRHDLHARYAEFPTRNLDASLLTLRAMGVRGFSVTAPHKREIIKHFDVLDEDAKLCGAVNTAVRDDEGRWQGYQLDVFGLEEAGADLGRRAEVAVVGSGGVVPAVLLAGRRLGWRRMTIYARNEQQREFLAERFDVAAAPLSALADQKADALLWCLPVDLPDLELPRPWGSNAVAWDLRYGTVSSFLGHAQERGFLGRDGLDMLREQALAQFALFCDRQPDEDDRRLVRDLLDQHVQQ